MLKAAIAAILLGLLSLGIFLIQIEYPATPNFDEFHYVPAARAFLAGVDNRNLEHPPLGKVLMSVGIALAGDRPLGWRIMSAVFGSLTLVAMFVWGLLLFNSLENALAVAAITFFNHLLYVQARIGMLDTFMFAFLAWAFVALTWALQGRRHETRALALCGTALGLAIACKWAAIVPWAAIVAFVAIVFGINEDGKVSGRRTAVWAACMIGLPAIVYLVTFLPFLFLTRDPPYTFWDLIQMQPQMWSGQLRVLSQHPYMSHWLDWPLLRRPIWYAFDHEKDHTVRGVLLLGNPWVMWTGVLACLACAWAGLRHRDYRAGAIAATYAILYFPWAIIPRKVSFYYYYYPAGMILSLAIVWALNHLDRKIKWAYVAVAAAFFAYFFPILSASKISDSGFLKWMWFSSWI